MTRMLSKCAHGKVQLQTKGTTIIIIIIIIIIIVYEQNDLIIEHILLITMQTINILFTIRI